MISYYLNRTRGTLYVSNVAIYGNSYFVGNFRSDEDAYAKLAEIYEAICNTNDEILNQLHSSGRNKTEFDDWKVTNEVKELPMRVSQQMELNSQLEFQFRQKML